MKKPKENPLKGNWLLNSDTVFLNHGSFGATPRIVLEEQKKWQRLIEKDPVKFFDDIAPNALLESRKAIASFVGCHHDDIAFVENATSGVNTILRSLDFNENDEILVPNHAYQACRNTIDFVAEKTGAVVVTCEIPFPVDNEQVIIEKILDCVSKKTKLALIDTVTSPTGLKMPFEKIVKLLEDRGIRVLLDAAHGIGMIPLNLDKIGASFTTSNCHKWLCAPKGSAFLHVRKDMQELIHPLTISHGMTFPLNGISRFRHEFDWTGTRDISAWCVIPFVINEISKIANMDWEGIMRHNNNLVIQARNIICEILEITPPCPDEMLSTIATIKLNFENFDNLSIYESDPIHIELLEKYNIQVPVWYWPNPEGRYIRISAQLYNHLEEYEYLALALKNVCQN